jgi:hypothetical protein
MKAKAIISTIIILILVVPVLAQEIYVYPNKKHTDAGLLEYRGYTLAEIEALERESSFAPYTTLAWGLERRLTDQENAYRARVVTAGDSIFCSYSTISAHATYFIRSLDGGINWEPYQTLEDTSRVLFHLWPEVLKNGSNLMIGLGVQEQGEGNCLYYFSSVDNGVTWSNLNPILPYTSWNFGYYTSFDNIDNRIYSTYVSSYYDSIYVLWSENWGGDMERIGCQRSLSLRISSADDN